MCGAYHGVKSEQVGAEEAAAVSERFAVHFGKDCKMSLAQKVGNETLVLLLKAPIPSATRHIMIDESNVDVLDKQDITEEELTAMVKACTVDRIKAAKTTFARALNLPATGDNKTASQAEQKDGAKKIDA